MKKEATTPTNEPKVTRCCVSIIPARACRKTDTVTVRSGEIVGLAGLLGSGMTEFLSSVFGAGGKPATLNLKGYAKKISSPADAIRQGIGLVPSERSLGLIMGLDGSREHRAAQSL